MKKYVLVEVHAPEGVDIAKVIHDALHGYATAPCPVRAADVSEIVCGQDPEDGGVFLHEGGYGAGEPFYPEWQ